MQKNYYISSFVGLLLLTLLEWHPIAAGASFAYNNGHKNMLRSAPPSSSNILKFIENKGQWDEWIQYKAGLPGGDIFLEKNSLTYIFVNGDDIRKIHPPQSNIMKDDDPLIIHSHVFRVNLIGANDKPEIIPHNPAPEHYNYFIGNDVTKWATDVNLFGKILYKNIYNGTDMSIYSEEQNLKYDFIVNPNSDAAKIRMHYDGVEKIYLKNGNLYIKTSVNELIEQQPLAWQDIDGRKAFVQCRFVLDGSVVRFEFPDGYNPDYKLIIDPKVIFASYSGSTADNWGLTATFDGAGHLYAGGIAFQYKGYINSGSGNGSYPTVGPYQSVFQGGYCDMAISKYSPDGSVMLYSTYLGGSGTDVPHSMFVNNNELIILGSTSSSNFPVTAGAFDVTFNGGTPQTAVVSTAYLDYSAGSDIVLAKLNSSGNNLLASTFIGGTGNDGLNLSDTTRYNYGDCFRGEVIADGDGRIYVATTTSSSDFPMVNPFQPSFGGGRQDGCVFKFTSDLTQLVWSSFLGGSADDAAYSVQFNKDFHMYVCGGTMSTDFPVTAGTLGQSNHGDVDGFITHIPDNGTTIISSTYIGTSAYDQTYFIQLDSGNNVYVLGQTEGNYPIQPDAVKGIIYSNSDGKQFIHKLNPALSTSVFSTVYGVDPTGPDISPSAFMVNSCENIFVSGWGGGTNQPPRGHGGYTTGLPVTPNANQTTTDGSDFHLLVLFKNAELILYGSFFGGSVSAEHVDGGTSRFDKNGIIYQSVCGGCGANSDFPTTPGSVSQTNNSSNCNNAVFKLEISDVVASYFYATDGCAPASVTFSNQSTGAIEYEWYFGDSTSSAEINPVHIYSEAGTYEVMLIAIDSITCTIRDTSIQNIVINPIPVIGITSDTTICPGDSITLNASGGVQYKWSSDVAMSCSACSSPVTMPDSATTYKVVVTDINGCKDSTTVIVFLYGSLPTANAGTDITLCKGSDINLNASGGVLYQWMPPYALDNQYSANPLANPAITTSYELTVTDINGCKDIDSVIVTVPDAFANAGPDTSVCIGSKITLNATGGSAYLWSPNSGLSSVFSPSPVASPIATTIYTVVVSDGLCNDSDQVEVVVKSAPAAITSGDTIICAGSTASLTVSGGDTYSWSTGESSSVISVSPGLTTIYSVTAGLTNGCLDSAQVKVTVQPLPLAYAGLDQDICEGENAMLTATGGTSYQWSSGELSQTIIVSPQISSGYSVLVKDNIGCEYSDTVLVTVNMIPVSDFIISGVNGCMPLTIIFTNTSQPEDAVSNYFWTFGDPGSGFNNSSNLPSPAHTYENDGVYTAILTLSGEKCNGYPKMTKSISVNVMPGPIAGLLIEPESASLFNSVITFTNISTGGVSCRLFTGDGDSSDYCDYTHEYMDTGNFKVTQIVSNAIGCNDTVTGIVYIRPEFAFFIPNSFTPNGDGINDLFYGRGVGVKDAKMYIYNRWGDEIFETNTLFGRWNGTANGAADIAQQDVYVYLIKVTDVFGFPHKFTGTVNMIR